MLNTVKSFYEWLLLFGIDPRKTLNTCRGLPIYFKNRRQLQRQGVNSSSPFSFGKHFPCLNDRFEQSGVAQGHYFHQDLLVAQKIAANQPQHHVDVGSRIDGFVAHVAAFREIEVLDIRELSATKVQNIHFKQCDMMQPLPAEFDSYCDSLSCLHALEHFGLGRYGDTVDFDGYLAGFNNLTRMLKPQGTLYLSVPMGPQRIEFDAHRVFSVKYLLDLFSDNYTVKSFSYIDDQGHLHSNTPLDDTNIETNFGCDYGCGVFELIKTS